VGGLMSLALNARAPFKFAVQHDRDPLYVVLADGSVRNGYTLKIENRAYHEVQFRVGISDLGGADLHIVGETKTDDGGIAVHVPADQLRAFRVYVHVARGVDLNPDTQFSFDVTDDETGALRRLTSMFRSPK